MPAAKKPEEPTAKEPTAPKKARAARVEQQKTAIRLNVYYRNIYMLEHIPPGWYNVDELPEGIDAEELVKSGRAEWASAAPSNPIESEQPAEPDLSELIPDNREDGLVSFQAYAGQLDTLEQAELAELAERNGVQFSPSMTRQEMVNALLRGTVKKPE